MLILYSAFRIPNSAFAAFEDTGTGAREAALSGGYVAAADDVLSLLYNPAGLANVNRHEMTSEYAKLFAGLSDGSNISQTFLAYGQPIQWGGTAAVGWKQFSLANLYSERTLSFGYGEWITPKVAAGFALKQLHEAFTPPTISVDDAGNVQNTTPSFFTRYGNTSTAYSGDLGFLIKPIDRYTVGFSVQDVNEPNVALSPADHEVINKTVRLGLSYDGPRELKLMGAMTSHKELSTGSDVTWTGAAEKWWGASDNGAFAARGSISTGSREFQQVALGAAYRLTQLQLDYAFVFNLTGITIGDTAGTHRFSLTYRFGKDRAELADARAKKAAAKKAAARRVPRDPEIEALLDEGLPLTTAPAKVKAQSGPGLTNVQVQTTPVPQAAVQAGDYAMPLSGGEPEKEKEIEPLTRLQTIARTLGFSTEYLLRVGRHVSANERLAALDPLFPTLEGYVRGSGLEMTDVMAQSDQLDAAKKEAAALVWEGASATERLTSLVQTLEAWLPSILRARVWNAQDGRDLRYRSWLESALADHARLIASGATAQLRLDSLRLIASRALDFEHQPSEPLNAPSMVAPVVVSTPTPVVPVTISSPSAAVAVQASTPTVVAPVPVKKPAHVTKKPAKHGYGPVPALYKVKEGDTLINLAERFYGDYKRWREIYMLNEDRLGRGGNLKPGQLLIMPPKDKQN